MKMNSTLNITLPNGECSAAAALRRASSQEEDTANLVWFGILLGIAGSIGVNVGQNIQNAGWDEMSDPKQAFKGIFAALAGLFPCTPKDERPVKLLWSDTGALIFISFAIVNFVAFGFAPASILAPLEGTQFLSNFWFNYQIDKDPVIRNNARRIGFGTFLIGLGVTLPVLGPILGGNASAANFDEEALKCMWGGTGWLFFAGASLLIAASCTLAYVQLYPSLKGPGKLSRNRLLQTLYALPSAVLGSLGVVNAKVISELIEILFKGIGNGDWSMLASWFLWVTIVLIIIGLGGWANRLNAGPGFFPKLTIIPLMNGAYILLSSTAGGLFFEEFEEFTWWGLLLYASGIFILLIGLVLIVPEVKEEEGNTPMLVVAKIEPSPEGQPEDKDLPVARVTLQIGAGMMGVLNYRSVKGARASEIPALLLSR